MPPSQPDPPAPERATEVPYDALAPDTLRRLCEEFVTRDGTDYGVRERSVDEKVDALMRELECGRARIYFEEESGTVNIIAAEGTDRS